MAESTHPDAKRSFLRSSGPWLLLFFAVALGLRTLGGLDVGYDEDTERYLYTGNDPYYHDRTVRHILETGEHLTFDPDINYPEGAYNPNPPLFDWTTAPVAAIFDRMGTQDPVGLALNLMVGVWGALTIFPVYAIGKDLWGHKAGLWASFLVAVSGPHIQRTLFGFADHDATTMVFIAMAFACLVKALKTFHHKEYVARWGDAGSRRSGVRAAMAENRPALLWSALAGIALTATAVTWKGYPYALAVMAIAVGLQLLGDHLRNKDSTVMFTLYVVPLAMVAVLPWLLYYRAFPTFLDTTVWPSIYVLLGVLVVGLIMVPTRNLPSIVVFPGLLLTALVALVLMLFVFPNVGDVIFSGLGYFEQSKLYTTIAEAQRSELGFVAASFGFFTFLLAFWGLGRAARGAWKGNAPLTLLFAWGTVALFMAFAASRFIMNAVPVFALLIGTVCVTLVDKIGLDEVRRRYRAQHGQNPVAAGFRSLDWRSALGILAVALLLVLPNAWIGVDAAIPSDYEARNDLNPQFFGAFGIDFELNDNGWNAAMARLATFDTEVPMKDRPAVIAWWDYGHWVTSIGEHPTVADPFQHHYNIAGRFLASESEEEAVSWLAILLLNHNEGADGAYSAEVRDMLAGYNSTLPALVEERGYDDQYAYLSARVQGDRVFALYDDVRAATGKSIEYMAVDVRMFPFGIQNSGIFYAPVFLANKNPDDFITTTYQASGSIITAQAYGVDEDGDSYRLKEPRYTDQTGREWVIYNGLAYPKGQTPLQGYDPATGASLFGSGRSEPTQKFQDSMFRRAYGGFQASASPGDGLSHWRAVHDGIGSYLGVPNVREVVVLQYYSGVTVSGRVTDDGGSPMPGVTVTFVDGYGASHDEATTAADGTYTVVAPFSQDGDLNLTVLVGGVPVVGDTTRQFTPEQAREGATVTGADLVVRRGNLEGHVFVDANGDGQYNATEGVGGATVTVDGRTTTSGTDGSYSLLGLQAGSRSAKAELDGYNPVTRSASILSDGTTTQDFALTPKTSATRLTFLDDGEGIAGIPIELEGPSARTVTTNATGVATATLAPGDYTATVNHTVTVEGVEQTYRATQAFTVAFGGEDTEVVINRD